MVFFELPANLVQALVLSMIELEKGWLDVLPLVCYELATDSHAAVKVDIPNSRVLSGVGMSRSNRNALSR
jgi:hypothetical protein